MTDASGPDPNPRYEYRVFAPDLRGLRALLKERGEAEDGETRQDVYILAPTLSGAGLKIRAGLLDLKVLDDHAGPYQLWLPIASARLPVPVAILAEEFLAPLRLELPLPDAGELDQADLLDIVEQTRGVRALRVGKRRQRFAIDGNVLAEWTALTFPDHPPFQTVALEGPDPDRLAGTVEALGLEPARNTSYPSYLLALTFPRSA